MSKYIADIDYIWSNRTTIVLHSESKEYMQAAQTITSAIDDIDSGRYRVCEKVLEESGEYSWVVNEWAKKAVILSFLFFSSTLTSSGSLRWYDKIPLKFDGAAYGDGWNEDVFKREKIRVVPGAIVRRGAYVGKNAVLMPSFVNVGAYVGDGTMVDTWSTIGSCAQIGKNCHISGGVGIGGVLEPIVQRPVVIEDNCFIGARSEVTEGVIVEEGSVIAMGVYLSSSTKIVDRNTGEIHYGRIPKYSVVVPGSIPSSISPNGLPINVNCAIIIKRVDEGTRAKTSVNELLRS